MLDHLRHIYSPQGETKVIYNARRSALFHREEKQPTIFTMGRIWDEGKNIKLLVDAAPRIHNLIRIAGDNSFAGDSIHLEQTNIEYLGKLSTQQVADELATASVFVMPAKYEPFGLAPLEAALSGCALVLGDIDSLREIWQDSALYVNTDDAIALAETINNLLNDKAALEHYANKASQQARSYTTDVMGKQYFKTYRKLLQQHNHLRKPETISK
jgi:glycosyltransferase involved in cell wall biosynthesis